MKIKKLIPVTSDYAVLATRKSDFDGLCCDKQGDGHNYFWALIDHGYYDAVELVDVGFEGDPRACSCRLVTPRKPCPSCNHQMEPFYNIKHRPVFWQECPHCGHVYDMRGHEEME